MKYKTKKYPDVNITLEENIAGVNIAGVNITNVTPST